MYKLTERSTVNAPPSDIWQFLVTLDNDRYLQWHPADHLACRIIKHGANGTRIGQVIYFEERIGP
jgi:hypothetical protein